MQKYLVDTFTGTAGTLLTAHTPETGGGYSLHPVYTGNLQLVGNGRVRSVDGNYGLVLSNAVPNERNQIFTATARCQTNSGYALVGMRASATVETYYQIGYIAGVGYQVTRFLAGVPTQIGSTVVAVWTAATDYSIRVEVRDHYSVPSWCRITLLVNDAVVLDVADTTPITGTRFGFITFGPASDSTGCQWAATANAWDTYRFDLRTQGDGQTMLIIPPQGWSDAGTDSPQAIQYSHGAGEDYSALATYGGDKEELVYALWAAGYLMFASNADGGVPATAQNWGNPVSVRQNQSAYQYVLDHYRVTLGQVLMWGQSMGGLDAFSGTFSSVYTYVGVLAVKPACNLAAMYAGVFVTDIKTAYGIAGDGSNYATKTYGSDPVLVDPDVYPVTLMHFVAASDDTLVVTATNTDVMVAMLDDLMIECSTRIVTGDHSSSQFYNTAGVADDVAFIARAFTYAVTQTSTAEGDVQYILSDTAAIIPVTVPVPVGTDLGPYFTLSKNGAAFADPSVGPNAPLTAVSGASNQYYVPLTTTDTDTDGPLRIRIIRGSGTLVYVDCYVGGAPSNTRAVNSIPVQGEGTLASPWRPA